MIKIANKYKENVGESIKKLQKALNSAGYSVSVDGKLGKETQTAVEDFQRKISVNGGSSSGASSSIKNANVSASSATTVSKNPVKKTTTTASATKSSSKKTNTNGRPEYQKSQAVTDAEKALSEWENNRPGEYESQYSNDIQTILDSILNREEFSYNMNADPLYQQYREQYIENGKKAMMDTVGNATALTGGYTNSYAQSVGQQTYDEYLNELNGIALELRDRAYKQYNDEGDKLLADVTLLRSLDGDDYDKYLGELERYYTDGNYLLDKLANMSDADFEAFIAEVDAWESDRDYEFKKYQDSLDRKEFEKELAYKKAEADREYAFKQAEAERDQANADRNYALALQKANEKAEKEEEKSKSESMSYPKTYKEFYERTGFVGVLTENEFKTSSTAKKKYGTYSKYLEAMYKKYA